MSLREYEIRDIADPSKEEPAELLRARLIDAHTKKSMSRIAFYDHTKDVVSHGDFMPLSVQLLTPEQPISSERNIWTSKGAFQLENERVARLARIQMVMTEVAVVTFR
ncbi:MAG: hypothetical protein UY35_C0009G0006 [Candidatus Saccharibacteria bacterium GW2011_GWC2_48_9]|nr:MAG: hypothetical protein UY35_C0009G0006 [Candidatus Saccharibacteria bacterium GW2011_GWC2_48_9]HCH34091.1 hypothetical protein [Candidatus Saccharibacteria bacterium]